MFLKLKDKFIPLFIFRRLHEKLKVNFPSLMHDKTIHADFTMFDYLPTIFNNQINFLVESFLIMVK